MVEPKLRHCTYVINLQPRGRAWLMLILSVVTKRISDIDWAAIVIIVKHFWSVFFCFCQLLSSSCSVGSTKRQSVVLSVQTPSNRVVVDYRSSAGFLILFSLGPSPGKLLVSYCEWLFCINFALMAQLERVRERKGWYGTMVYQAWYWSSFEPPAPQMHSLAFRKDEKGTILLHMSFTVLDNCWYSYLFFLLKSLFLV